MTEVRLFHTSDGGEVEFADSAATTTDLLLDAGLETAAYLSLFGGNERDPGGKGDSEYQWWGNRGEPVERQQRSETQHIVRSLPAISSNLRRVEDAAKRDLQWFLDESIASEVDALASLVGKDKVSLDIRIVISDKEYAFAFKERWGS